MLITSIHFVLFTGLALGGYYLLSRRPQNLWLLFISYIFIATWKWQFAVLLAGMTAINFLLASRLRVANQPLPGVLWIGICFNVLILLIFRATGFFVPDLEAVFLRLGIPVPTDGLRILVPLGISYYVLQIISYLVDVYRGQLKAEPDFIDFALFLAYFPKIIAGPIERPRTFLQKLAQRRVVDEQVIARSVVLIFVGLVRKLLIADLLTAFFLSDVFELPAKYNPPELVLWLLIYAFALYNDFAGYTNIVRGVSGLFGIELSPNFRTPYFSRSFSEFWNRWHISLSEWLRDYIYYPASRALSRRNPDRRDLVNIVLPPMVTMLVSGLWHGFGLHMLIWGGLHGVYLILERLLALWRPAILAQNQPPWRQGLQMGVVFTLVILAWVPFGWELPAAFEFWGALFNWSSFAIRYNRLFVALLIVFGSLVLDYLQYRTQDEFISLKWPGWVKAACMAILLLLFFIATGGDFQEPFVYQAF